jgi:hypothetical protein
VGSEQSHWLLAYHYGEIGEEGTATRRAAQRREVDKNDEHEVHFLNDEEEDES